MTMLAATAKAEDATRTIVYAANAGNQEDPTNWQSQATAFNEYQGWYGGKAADFAGWADAMHSGHPKVPIGVSEYGAGASIASHSLPNVETGTDRTAGVQTEEYQTFAHETWYKAIQARPFFLMTTIWALFDFASDDRNEGLAPGLNTKGIVTYDRATKKDAFYFYKANWSSAPVLYITSRRFATRTSAVTDVKIYSNLDAVTLTVNGVSLGTLSGAGNPDRIFKWSGVQLQGGSNLVQVTGTKNGQTYADSVTWTLSVAGSQSPFHGSPFGIVLNGSTTIQAEDFDNGGEGIAYHDLEAANLGRKYRPNDGVDLENVSGGALGANVAFAKAGEWLEYSIDVKDAGVYTATFNVAAASDNGKFHLEMDGVDVTGQMGMPNTSGWQSWKTVSKGGLNLAGGSHVLRLVMDANGSSGYVGNIDALTIEGTAITPPPGAQTPFGTMPVVKASGFTTIGAELFDNGGEGVAYHDSDAVNSGGAYRQTGVDLQPVTLGGSGYNVGWAVAGEWLKYTIGAEAGTFDWQFRVASPGDGGKFHAEIDGVNVTGLLSAPNTAGWQNWTTVTKSGISLVAGTHVLRLAMDVTGSAGGTANFDYMAFTSSATVPPPGSQTPFWPAPFAINRNGATTIEMEDYDKGGEGVAYHDFDAVNNGTQYRNDRVDIEKVSGDVGGYDVGWTQGDEWLEYSVDVADAGLYNIDFRVAANGVGGNFHLEVDGVDVTGRMTIVSTGGWQNWSTITKYGVNLTAGQHVLRLAMDVVGPTIGAVGNFNYLKITPAGSPTDGQTPFGGTPFVINTGSVTTIQAEDFDLGGEGVAFHDTDPANVGGKYRSSGVDIETVSGDAGAFNVGYARAGEWLEYSVNVLTAGTYSLDFRVASAAAGGKWHVEMDGLDVTGQMLMSNTGGWQSWATVTKSGVSLSAGQHVMRLVMDADGGSGYVGNFNYVMVR
jgi:hypothetical protein